MTSRGVTVGMTLVAASLAACAPADPSAGSPASPVVAGSATATQAPSPPPLGCSPSRTTFTALPDLGTGTYEGEPGGLYAAGSNAPPPAYAQAGLAAATRIVARDLHGAADSAGHIVLLAISMSNGAIEFNAFTSVAQRAGPLAPRLVLVNGAQGGKDARSWANPEDAAWSEADQRLAQAGVDDAQVEAIWLKQAQAGPASDFETYTHSLAGQMSSIVATAARRYPNLDQVFVSPRTYGGYATSRLNPEPYAYWSGFADRLLVEQSVAHPGMRPWIGWGAYLWTDGTAGRSDGLAWTCTDVGADGTHPSPAGAEKVGGLLEAFFSGSEFTPWFRGAG